MPTGTLTDESMKYLLEKLATTESIARQLEPDSKQRTIVTNKILAYSESFLENLASMPAYNQSDTGIGLYDAPISEQPIDVDAALELLESNVDSTGVNAPSPNFLGYVPGGGLYHSALGDFLAAVANRYAGVFYAAPGAVRMENMLLAWMADVMGYPQTAVGNLTTGGSMSNLIGVVVARDVQGLKARDYEKAVVYLTKQAHHSVDKALRIAGLNECVRRVVSMDDAYRMDSDALEKALGKDKRAGLIPLLIVASAGTTDVGAVDPLGPIADIAAQHDVWLHVDGAYGALFALCEEGKRILTGIERSDSIALDPHKSLFLPYGSGAVLVKKAEHLYNTFSADAAYMQDQIHARQELSPADLSPELTKHFRGLRLWLPLKLLGTRPFAAALEEKLLLARYFYQRIREIDGFEVGPPPDLSIATFRYVPERGDANAFNQKLLQAVHDDGRVYMSSTTLDGHFTIRMAALSFRTHRDTIDRTIEVLQEKVGEVLDTS